MPSYVDDSGRAIVLELAGRTLTSGRAERRERAHGECGAEVPVRARVVAGGLYERTSGAADDHEYIEAALMRDAHA